jgi:hypothetical protein
VLGSEIQRVVLDFRHAKFAYFKPP